MACRATEQASGLAMNVGPCRRTPGTESSFGLEIACSVALQAIETLLAFPWQENAARIGQRLAEGLEPCRNLPGVEDVRALGAIGVVETKKPVDTERMQAFFVESGVWIRPFSRLVYLMPPLVAANDEIDALCAAIRKACERGLHL